MKLKYLALLALLLALPAVSALPSLSDIVDEQVQWTSGDDVVYSTFYIEAGDTVNWQFRSGAPLESENLYMTIWASDNVMNTDTILLYNCTGQLPQQVRLVSWSWGLVGLVSTLIPNYDNTQIPIPILNELPATERQMPGEAGYLHYWSKCTFTIIGEDVRATLSYQPAYTNSLESLFELPTMSINELSENVYQTLLSAFDIARELLIVAAIIIFIFFLVFLWKLIEYVASRVKKSAGGE